MLKASRWAGNVGELAKQRSPISSPLFPAFTPLPYYRVYRSAFTPLGPPTRHTLQAHGHELEGGKWGERKQTRGEAGHTPSAWRAERSRTRLSCVYLLPTEWDRALGGMALELKWDEVMRWIVLSGWCRAEQSPLHSHTHTHTLSLSALLTCHSSTQPHRISKFVFYWINLINDLWSGTEGGQCSPPLAPLARSSDTHMHTQGRVHTKAPLALSVPQNCWTDSPPSVTFWVGYVNKERNGGWCNLVRQLWRKSQRLCRVTVTIKSCQRLEPQCPESPDLLMDGRFNAVPQHPRPAGWPLSLAEQDPLCCHFSPQFSTLCSMFNHYWQV